MSLRSLRVNRRQALGLAAGGAAAAAGLRVATLRLGGTTLPGAQASAAGPAGAWTSPLGSDRGRAAHLLRRAGFAPSDSDLDQAGSMSYSDLVEKVVGQKPDPLAMPSDATNYRAVVQAWYTHMASTSAQYCERMALFWHGVLTSDYRKANRRPYVWQQNQLFRQSGRGDLRSLLVAVTHDPLMMEYLDLSRSSAKAPNENYSRELMELYTLGVGNFSEQDVREGARALSGLRPVAVDASGTPVKLPTPGKDAAARQRYYQQIANLVAQGVVFRGQLVARMHDSGSKSYLGRTGNLGPDDVIDAILARDATASFIARKAIVSFALPQPSDAYVARIAEGFRASRYDITTLMRSIFLSDEFSSPDAYRALVRTPADYMIAAMRALSRPQLARTAVTAGQGMDMVLYDPPTVAGWPVNGGWLSSSSWLARVNFAQQAVAGQGKLPDPARAVSTHFDGVVGPDTAQVFDASHTDIDRWYALVASPEFSLK